MAHTDAEITAKFWAALRKDMTVMLGLDRETDQRPMTAQLEGKEDRGPVWFFGSRDTDLASQLATPTDAQFSFVSKGHDVWATVTGTLAIDNDRTKIDALWNPYAAAWYEDGKDDPNLALMRFDASHAKIWLDGSSLIAGVLAIFGRDPKEDYKDNIAEVTL